MNGMRAAPGPSRCWRPSHWSIWTQPTRVWVWLVVVESLAASLIALSIVSYAELGEIAEYTIPVLGLIAAGIGHAELSIRAERIRRRLAETRYVDLSSVWTIAAALVLPPVLAIGVVLIIYTHLYVRVYRPAGTPPHRQIYSNTTVVLAVYSVGTLNSLLGSFGVGSTSVPIADLAALPLMASVICYMLVNTSLIVAVIRLSRPGSSFWKIFAGGEILLELSTLSLGALGAIAISAGSPAITVPLTVLILLLPLMLLEYTTVIGELQRRVDIDGKTGLLNPQVWEAKVEGLIDIARRRGGAVAVLVLDLDHFKRVNDVHGHLVGDAVLGVVATVLRREVRDHDVIGRFGGEEFVIALTRLRKDTPSTARDSAAAIAERIRTSIEQEPVEVDGANNAPNIPHQTVSIGGVVVDAGTYSGDVAELVAVADGALYEAKAEGRNRCRFRSLDPPASAVERATHAVTDRSSRRPSRRNGDGGDVRVQEP